MNQEPQVPIYRVPTLKELAEDTILKTRLLQGYVKQILEIIKKDASFTPEVMDTIVNNLSDYDMFVPGIEDFVIEYEDTEGYDTKKKVFIDFITHSNIDQINVIRRILYDHLKGTPRGGGGKRSTGKKASQKQKKQAQTRSIKKKAKKTKASRRR